MAHDQASSDHAGRVIRLPDAYSGDAERGYAAVLDALGLGVLVLRKSLEPVSCNSVARALVEAPDGPFILNAAGSVSVRDPSQHRAFQRAVSRMAAPAGGHGEGPRPTVDRIDMPDRAWLVIVTSIPAAGRGAADAVAPDSPCALVLIEPVGQPKPIAPDLLSIAHKLTEAESELASALAEGVSVKQHAKNLDRAPKTMTNHLQKIFEKTGTNSQAQLTAMLLGLKAASIPPRRRLAAAAKVLGTKRKRSGNVVKD